MTASQDFMRQIRALAYLMPGDWATLDDGPVNALDSTELDTLVSRNLVQIRGRQVRIAPLGRKLARMVLQDDDEATLRLKERLGICLGKNCVSGATHTGRCLPCWESWAREKQQMAHVIRGLNAR